MKVLDSVKARKARARKAKVRKATELAVVHDRIESTTLHVMGIAVAAISLGMFVGGLVEWGSTNRDTGALFLSAALALVLGAALWWLTTPGAVRARDVFAAVGWTWLAVTLVGAVPYLLGGTFDVPGIDRSGQFVNAIFESASGYSCTGSTALTDFDHPGRGMLMYRQITQWYGGMGIVVLAVAVLPFLGVGGLDLMSAEAPGPSGDRLTPRVSETAKRLWATYALFTIGVAVALIAIPGPSVYDGIAHGLTTASTGGFSPYGDSVGTFDSVAVEIAIIVGMVLAWAFSLGIIKFGLELQGHAAAVAPFLMAGGAVALLLALFSSVVTLQKVLENTSNGDDETDIRPEGGMFAITDWIVDGMPIMASFFVSFAPGCAIVNALQLGPEYFLLAAFAAYFVFPVVLISMMENATILGIYSKPVLGSLREISGTWVKFYALSFLLFAPFCGTILGLAYLSAQSFDGRMITISLAAIFGALAFATAYCRLLGRLALVMADKILVQVYDQEEVDSSSGDDPVGRDREMSLGV